jgi:transcriptional regulator with XRE-family HTH domain
VNPSTVRRRTTEEWLEELGAGLRERRIRAELTQEELARLADVGTSAVKNLESGEGANLTSFIKVARALGAEDWLAGLRPPAEPGVSPMQLLRQQRRAAPARQRVRKRSR